MTACEGTDLVFRLTESGRIQPDRPIVAERPLEELRGRRAGAGKQTVTH